MPSYLKAAEYEPKSPQEKVEGLSCLLPLENRVGFVFVVASINKKNIEGETLFQLLRDQAHRLTSAFGKDANAQHRFEQFLGALNETLAHHIREGRFYLPIQNFHALVGIVCDEEMYLSGTGELSALFLHRKQNQRYQVFNIFRSIQTEQALPTWEKPFAVVLDGELKSGDVFCVSHKDIQRAVSQDDLHQILTSLPPKSAVEKIRQYFPSQEGVLLIVLKAEDARIHLTEFHAKPLSDVSIDSFVRAQDETARLLEDQRPNLIKFLRVWLFSLYKKHAERSRLLYDLKRGDSKSKVAVRICHAFMRILTRATKRWLRHLVFAARFISKKETRAQAIAYTRILMQKIRVLPKRTQRSLLLVVLLVFVLIIGLIFLSRANTKSQKTRAYQNSISQIEDLVERATGAMIYRDENQARFLFKDAVTQVDALPTDKPARVETKQRLLAEIESAMNELRHVIMVPNPALLGDLANNGVQSLYMVTNTPDVYAIGSDNHVYQLDSIQKRFNRISPDPITSSTIVSASLEDHNLYVLDATDKVFVFKTDAKIISAVPISLEPGAWKKMHAYANRLYFLQNAPDGSDSQLIRFQKSGDLFAAGQSWIVSKSHSLAEAISFALDGSLFVLKPNGEAYRFQNGSEVGWQLGAVDPNITNATVIKTNADSAFVYILEPKQKRLIVYKKDSGAFLVQYKSDAFQDLKDIEIDEKNYTIYLLSGTKVYSIAASHLKKS